MEKGRYTVYSKTRLPRKKRTIRLSGSFEDRNKYIRCWNCGFIVDVDRDLGDSERDGKTYPYHNLHTTLDTLNDVGTVVGDRIYPAIEVEVTKGCKFCGCVNL